MSRTVVRVFWTLSLAGWLAGSGIAPAQEGVEQSAPEPPDAEAVVETIVDDLSCTLTRAERALGDLEAATEEDGELAEAAWVASAEALRSVHRSVAILYLADGLPVDLVDTGIPDLQVRLRRASGRLSRLRPPGFAGSVTDTDPGLPLPPRVPAPQPPNPVCMWICEQINRLRCSNNPDCTVIPCGLYC